MSDNPKALAATRDSKPRLDLLEYDADCVIADVLAHGAEKYGRKNYLTIPIKSSVYGGATRRHVGSVLKGEWLDPESGLPHWGHIGANAHVVLAAVAHGNFVDDSAPAERTPEQEARSSASNEVPTDAVQLGRGLERRLRERIAAELAAAAQRDGDWYGGTTDKAMRVVLGER